MEKYTYTPNLNEASSEAKPSWLSESNQVNTKGNEMAVDTVEIKVNGKEVNLGGKSKAAKTDFQNKPKFLGLYFNANGKFIEQTDGKTEDKLKENLVLLQSNGHPNATVVIYSQGKAHKIKQQFDTV